MKTRCDLLRLLMMSLCLLWKPASHAGADEPGRIDRSRSLRSSWGTYDGEPRRPDGLVDVERLVRELVELRANTYNWLIWHRATDWDDLKRFLPAARAKGIRVWVCLVPPSESPPHTSNYSEPFQLDYHRWGVEIAKLSLREPNLVAWTIDDFTHNLKFYNPQRLREILDATRKINPKLAFAPCSYFPRITPRFARDYQGLLDGLLFPYRHESSGANLTDASLVEEEVKRIRQVMGPSVAIVVDVYASAHGRLGSSTPEYVRQVMTAAKRSADGVHVYCHQNPKTEKYRIIKDLFHTWSAEPGPKK